MKDSWERPELIVLVRSQPEESVLTGCKHSTVPGGPNGANTSCETMGGLGCGNCDGLGSS